MRAHLKRRALQAFVAILFAQEEHAMHRRSISVLRALAVALLLVMPIQGCGNEALKEADGRLYVKWSEEVQLSDGRIIIAERSDEYLLVSDSGSGWGRKGWLYQRGSFRATLPAPISTTVEWQGSLHPLVLDIFPDGAIYFVGIVAAAKDFDEWKIPWQQVNKNPWLAYVIFRLTDSGWQRMALSDLPQSAKPNFLANTREFFEGQKALKPGSTVRLEQKKAIDSNPRLAKELRTIVRPAQDKKE